MTDTQESLSEVNEYTATAVQALIDGFNERAPEFLKMMNGRMVSLEPAEQRCALQFDIGKEFCHSGDIVQGGFVTAMLDATMSHAVFGAAPDVTALSSLEISTRYLEVSRAGVFTAHGRVLRLSWKTAFLDGQLHDRQGRLLATAQGVARIRRGD